MPRGEAAISATYLQSSVADGVLHVTIDRAEKRNAIAQAVLGELGATFRAHAGDATLRLAVIRGAGTRCFAAGGDLHEFESLREATAVREMNRFSTAALDAIRDFPLPVIAALNGDAIGGGGELAMACDMRVFARLARIGFVQGQMCISTAWGGGADLMRVAGAATALRMLTRAEFIAADEARLLGLADAVQDADEDFAATLETFIAPMRERKPHVMRAYKALARGMRQDDGWRAVRAAEPELLASTWLHDDHWTASAAAIARIAAKKG
ncbi:MAG: enoyl-CoA hydratase/isomerase family protein [Gammaproteobacteria bacterium]